MAFTPESRAKGAARVAENRARRAAGLAPLPGARSHKAPSKRAPKAQPTITLSPADQTSAPPAQTLGDPGESPAKQLHSMLMMLFGPINYMLHRAGGFDLIEEEVDLILIPAERIAIRHGLAAGSGQINPDLFDGLQIAVGVIGYGIRVSPQIAAKRAGSGSGAGGGQPAGAPRGGSPVGNSQGPSTPPVNGMAGASWSAVTPESLFADVGIVAESISSNGNSRPPGVDTRLPGQTGSGGG